MSPEEDRSCDAVDSEPKHYLLSYSGTRPGDKAGFSPTAFSLRSSHASDVYSSGYPARY